MKRIVRIISVSKRLNQAGGAFYLSSVELDDGEEYSLAHHQPPLVGEEVEAWFDDRYQKAKAIYPQKSPKSVD